MNLISNELNSRNFFNFEFNLLFDTELDGFSSSKFHEKCDFKENLLILF
jgi:hypothetical protein